MHKLIENDWNYDCLTWYESLYSDISHYMTWTNGLYSVCILGSLGSYFAVIKRESNGKKSVPMRDWIGRSMMKNVSLGEFSLGQLD